VGLHDEKIITKTKEEKKAGYFLEQNPMSIFALMTKPA
jgi:hypothetical protein